MSSVLTNWFESGKYNECFPTKGGAQWDFFTNFVKCKSSKSKMSQIQKNFLMPKYSFWMYAKRVEFDIFCF